ncbi:hypothetical protein KKH59_05300 [Patescibacteria group bacterium]|nr:hypothetical protein [Patescibacteria group bacterium]
MLTKRLSATGTVAPFYSKEGDGISIHASDILIITQPNKNTIDTLVNPFPKTLFFLASFLISFYS